MKTRVFIMAMVVAFASFANVQAQKPMKPGHENKIEFRAKRMAEKHPESMINELVNGDLSKVNGKTAFDAMRAGDKWGKKVVDNYVKYLGEGVINYINIFQPDIILLGGGISKEGDTLLKPLRRYVFKYAYGSKFLKRCKIECATLGNDAGIVGAAML